MHVLASLLQVERNSRMPVYLQLANQLTGLIKSGTLQPGTKLLSSRELSVMLQVHRRTIVQAYDELLAQGWLESQTGSGTFVAKNLPLLKIEEKQPAAGPAQVKHAGFTFEKQVHLNRSVIKNNTRLHLDDGFPDPRLAPIEDLSRAYRSQLLNGNPYIRLGYGDTKGSSWLRQELSVYLNETRGMQTTPENILIIRGSIMGIHLASTLLLRKGDIAAIDTPGWAGANMNFAQAGAQIVHLPVDAHGLQVDALEALCEKKPVRMLYVTSHHHYPTTVALRADRRLKLLQLAEKYRFIIFEDDYDYDFHYLSKPLLPLAGGDKAGMVLYCGSFTKTISPAFRVGYLVGPEDVIAEMAMIRRIIDRQGDQMLENAIAELLQTGVIQRHLRKSLRIYRQRRDYFCDLLRTELRDAVEFQVPDGGMAVWTRFKPDIKLKRIAEEALKKDLYFSDGSLTLQGGSSTRLGFASSSKEELEESVQIIRKLL